MASVNDLFFSTPVWVLAIASTLLISLVPFLLLTVIPLDNTARYRPWLKVLLSFACGGLLGDAFLHLIPHALIAQQLTVHSVPSGHSHSHSHSHNHGHSHGGHGHSHGHSHDHEAGSEGHNHDMVVGLWVLAGVLAFLMVEKLVRIARGPGHGHSHSPPSSPIVERKKSAPERVSGDASETQLRHRKSETQHSDQESENVSKTKKVRFAQVDSVVTTDSQSDEIQIAGYLNLAADFFHNLTDGLAIGATFVRDPKFAIATTVTILLHEIPHEIGDFAILLQSGCSRKKAMYLQLITAFGAVLGTVISLIAEGTTETASTWILPFTAGGFIYIACVSVIPEILKETNFIQSVYEIIAAAIGVGTMILIAKAE